MAEFGKEDLSGSLFDWTDLSGSTFRYASLSDVMIRGTDLYRVTMRDVELRDVDISGEIEGLVINGVDVTAYVNDELVRRDPVLGRLTPDNPAASWRRGTSSSPSGRGPWPGPARSTRRCSMSRSRRSGVHPDVAAPAVRVVGMAQPRGPR